MKPETYPFVPRPLPYEYHELAPILSMETLMYHHDKHYKNYVDQLNHALADYPELQNKSLKELLTHLEQIPLAARTMVKNNGGGVFNHELYFDEMSSENNATEDPKGALGEAIERDFGGMKSWKDQMKNAAVSKFGSGWAWLLTDEKGKLFIAQTSNQDVPDLAATTPILLVDVWEHAYYLQYQNRRADYVDGWFRLIHWKKAQKRYEQRSM